MSRLSDRLLSCALGTIAVLQSIENVLLLGTVTASRSGGGGGHLLDGHLARRGRASRHGVLYSRHRMNVAVSRAHCLAVLVCSPDLLRVACTTAAQIPLANALCAFIELATMLPGAAERDRTDAAQLVIL